MENRNFVPEGVRLHEMSKVSSKQIIPSLQRPYTWDKTNINKLWRDILENPSPYFIGTVVFTAGEGSSSRDEVIDGQQRLTTIALMLIVIRNYFQNKKAKNGLVNEIKHLLLEPVFEGTPSNRLCFTNKISNDIYNDLVNNFKYIPNINAKNEIEKKFVENFIEISNLFKESIKNKESTPEKILEKIKNLELIVIMCSSKTSGYKLFESLNATAESLASVDLIKNSLFMKLSNDKRLLERAEENWQSLELKFADSRAMFKTFIRHQWLSSVDYVSHSNLFEQFEKSI